MQLPSLAEFCESSFVISGRVRLEAGATGAGQGRGARQSGLLFPCESIRESLRNKTFDFWGSEKNKLEKSNEKRLADSV